MMHKTADGSYTLVDEALGVSYHSLDGAISESVHVFIEGSGLAGRLQQGGVVRLLEVGYGTGQNAALALELAAKVDTARLEYVAYEPAMPAQAVLEAYYQLLDFEQALVSVVKQGAGEYNGHSLQVRPAAWPAKTHERFGVIFYDAFAPSDAPEMWTEATFGAALDALAPGGVLVTYSVTGATKRLLEAKGLRYERPKGYGRKRHMLRVFG